MLQKKVSKTYRIFAGFSVAIGIIFLIAGLIVLFSRFRFKEEAVEIPAIISDILYVKSSGGEYNYNVFVSYVYDGEIHNNVPLNFYSNSMYEGQKVILYCDPEHPGNIKLKYMYYFLPVLLIAVGGVLFLIGGTVLLVALISFLRLRRLQIHGKTVYAIVDEIIGDRNYFVNHIHPFLIYCSYKDDETDTIYKYESEYIWDPFCLPAKGSMVEVWVDKNDYTKYHVNVKALKKRVMDFG